MDKKSRWYLSEEKETEEVQNSGTTTMISVDWKESFSSEVETAREIVWIKIFKKTEF